jgi:hypothetical protein
MRDSLTTSLRRACMASRTQRACRGAFFPLAEGADRVALYRTVLRLHFNRLAIALTDTFSFIQCRIRP